MRHETAEQAILAQERRALDQWSQGKPLGYAANVAEDVTYFDDIGAHSRVVGREAVTAYFASLQGKIPVHRYEITNPDVQVYDDIGILTLHYLTFAPDGSPLTPWKATLVYRLIAGEWRTVHAHWSILKQPSP